MSIPLGFRNFNIRGVTLDSGINGVIYTDTDTVGKKKEYVDENIELYYNNSGIGTHGNGIGTLKQIRAAGIINRAAGTDYIFNGNPKYPNELLGTVEQLKYKLHVKVQQGGARKSLRKRKNKKSRKGKSKKNRRKSNRRR